MVGILFLVFKFTQIHALLKRRREAGLVFFFYGGVEPFKVQLLEIPSHPSFNGSLQVFNFLILGFNFSLSHVLELLVIFAGEWFVDSLVLVDLKLCNFPLLLIQHLLDQSQLPSLIPHTFVFETIG